jgi:type IV secretion system protein TrbL
MSETSRPAGRTGDRLTLAAAVACGCRRADNAPRSGRRPRRALPLAALAFCAALLLLLLAAAAGAQTPPAGEGVLDGVVRSYQTISSSWLERIAPLAERTFAVLAALEFAVSGLWWALGREALDAVLAALLKKFVLLSFLYSLIYLFPFWVPAIFRGFEAAGQAASGSTAVNPSQVLDLGITIASNILLSFGSIGFLANPSGNLIASFTALAVVVAFSLIAAQIVLTLVESYVVLTGGCLFLGFAAFRSTVGFAENYILYAFRTGAKLYLLYLLVGVGTGLARQWATLQFVPDTTVFAPSLAPHFQVLAGSVIFCVLVWTIPGGVASRLTQGASLRLQEALR